jgi:hypothetical protein
LFIFRQSSIANSGRLRRRRGKTDLRAVSILSMSEQVRSQQVGVSESEDGVMGNGFRSRNSGVRGALGAGLALVAAGCLLLGVSARHSSESAAAQPPDSPLGAATSGARLIAANQIAANQHPDLHSVLGQLPLIFEPNQGQADRSVRFLAHGVGYGLYLDSAGAVLAVPTASAKSAPRVAALRMKLVDPNPQAVLSRTGQLPGHSNYFIGNDPHKWHRNIPQFSGVRYQNIYPGIDLVFYGNGGQLEYDFQVAPGADASRAQMEFDGATGLKLSHGDLILNPSSDGRVLFHAPHIYQRIGDREQSVSGGFALLGGNRAGFEIGPYDHSRELIIDPVPEIESYFGGSGSDTFPSIAVDPSGTFLYLAGTTTSPQSSFTSATTTTQTSIPSTLTITPTGPTHVFVAKILPSQPPAVEYETFLGGSDTDTATGVAVDGAGDAYLVGNTTSPDFPTTPTTAYQNAPETKTVTCTGTCSSIFVSVIDPQGTGFLNYSSYISGDGNDVSSGMAIDANGDVFITGTTTSNDTPSITDAFPATEAPPAAQTGFQIFPLASLQFFVTKVNTQIAGTASIAYSTYFGGGTPSNPDPTENVGGGIAVDAAGNMYFSGTTNFVFTGTGRPPDFPILNPYQPCLNTPPPTVITTPLSCSPPFSSNTDAFVAKLNPNTVPGQQLGFSTYLGGSNNDSSTSLAIDSGAANIYVTGTTNSNDFILPTGTASFQSSNTCGTCAYVGRFNNPKSANMSLTYFSYLGGTSNDGVTNGLAVSVDNANGALLTGSTTSATLPVTASALQSSRNGPQNAFFARIDTATVSGQSAIGSYLTYFGGNGFDRGTSVIIDPNNTNTYLAGDTTSTNLPTENPLLPPPPLNGTTPHEFFVKLGTSADLCMNCVPPVISPSEGIVPAGSQITIGYTVLNNGPDLATDIEVLGSTSSSSVAIKSASASSGTCTTQVSGGNVGCNIQTLQPGATATIKFNVVPSAAGNYETTATVSSLLSENDPNPGNNVEQASFTASDFSVKAAPASETINAGQTASYIVTLTPSSVYSASISLTASSSPGLTATTMSFLSNSLTPGQASVATTLNVATTPRLIPVAGLRHRGAVYAFWLALPGLGLLGLGAGGKRKHIIGIMMLALCALILFQPACSSSTQPTAVSGTPAGTYTITVTATSGSDTHQKNVTLNVQ